MNHNAPRSFSHTRHQIFEKEKKKPYPAVPLLWPKPLFVLECTASCVYYITIFSEILYKLRVTSCYIRLYFLFWSGVLTPCPGCQEKGVSILCTHKFALYLSLLVLCKRLDDDVQRHGKLTDIINSSSCAHIEEIG